MEDSEEMGTTFANTSKMQNLEDYMFPRTLTKWQLMLFHFSVAEDAHKGLTHPLAAAICLVLLPA